MLILVYGGAASGKSRLGEQYCAKLGLQRAYIATMRPVDDESYLRIRRHRTQREAFGFDTVECYQDLDKLQLERRYETTILECMGNLVANELFDNAIPARLLEGRVMEGIAGLLRQTNNLVIISNAVFGESRLYTGGMAEYVRGLGRLNCRIAAAADIVVEAVCGLPLIQKGKGVLQ